LIWPCAAGWSWAEPRVAIGLGAAAGQESSSHSSVLLQQQDPISKPAWHGVRRDRGGAGLAHLWFLTLHPYEDGNGRLARAITDQLLAQGCKAQAQQALSGRALGLSVQFLRERKGYYAALERCQRGDQDVTGWRQ